MGYSAWWDEIVMVDEWNGKRKSRSLRMEYIYKWNFMRREFHLRESTIANDTAVRKLADEQRETCFSVVGFAKVVKQRQLVPFIDSCFPSDRNSLLRNRLSSVYVYYSRPTKPHCNRVYEPR